MKALVPVLFASVASYLVMNSGGLRISEPVVEGNSIQFSVYKLGLSAKDHTHDLQIQLRRRYVSLRKQNDSKPIHDDYSGRRRQAE